MCVRPQQLFNVSFYSGPHKFTTHYGMTVTCNLAENLREQRRYYTVAMQYLHVVQIYRELHIPLLGGPKSHTVLQGIPVYIQCPVFSSMESVRIATEQCMRTLPYFVPSLRISPAPRKAQHSTSTSNDSQEFSALKLHVPTGIVLEDFVISKLTQVLSLGFRRIRRGQFSKATCNHKLAQLALSRLNEIKSALLCADAMVMRASIAPSYVTAWSKKYLVIRAEVCIGYISERHGGQAHI